MNTPHESAMGHIRAACAALQALKRLAILTDTTIAAITSSGTIAKLLALIDSKIVSPPLHDADQIRQAQQARADLLRVLTGYGTPVVTDADIETARAAGSANFNALYNPLVAKLTLQPANTVIESAGRQ